MILEANKNYDTVYKIVELRNSGQLSIESVPRNIILIQSYS